MEELSYGATDFCWFSLDKMNHLSASMSAGGFVPGFVESDLRLHVELEKCIFGLSKFENNSVINDEVLEEFGHNIYDTSKPHLSNYVMYTEFGLYTYDNQISYERDFDIYKWYTRPILKLNLKLLPAHLVERLHVFPDIIFSEHGSFQVNPDKEMIWL